MLGGGLVEETGGDAQLSGGTLGVAGGDQGVELAGLGAQAGTDSLVTLTGELVGEDALLLLLDVSHGEYLFLNGESCVLRIVRHFRAGQPQSRSLTPDPRSCRMR